MTKTMPIRSLRMALYWAAILFLPGTSHATAQTRMNSAAFKPLLARIQHDPALRQAIVDRSGSLPGSISQDPEDIGLKRLDALAADSRLIASAPVSDMAAARILSGLIADPEIIAGSRQEWVDALGEDTVKGLQEKAEFYRSHSETIPGFKRFLEQAARLDLTNDDQLEAILALEQAAFDQAPPTPAAPTVAASAASAALDPQLAPYTKEGADQDTEMVPAPAKDHNIAAQYNQPGFLYRASKVLFPIGFAAPFLGDWLNWAWPVYVGYGMMDLVFFYGFIYGLYKLAYRQKIPEWIKFINLFLAASIAGNILGAATGWNTFDYLKYAPLIHYVQKFAQSKSMVNLGHGT